MKIGRYISELLYTHDSVILPGFGTFSTKYEPAKFIPEKKIVESPSKIAYFSAEPKQGETPLVHLIAESEGKSHEEVSEMISTLVTEIEHALEAGNQVEVESVGLFQKDIDGILKFEPNRNVNYLEDYTGVSAIKTPEQHHLADKADAATDRKAEESTIAPGLAEAGKHAISKKKSIPSKKQKTMTEPEKKESKEKAALPPVLKWIAIILIPILILLIIFFWNFEYFVGEGGVFRKAPPPVTVEEVVPDVVTEEELVEEVHIPEPEPEPVFDPYLEPPKPPTDRPVYIVVVGSFRNNLNAQSLALELRKDGARLASVLDQVHSGFYRTYYGYYLDLREAEAVKASLDDELREVAWILHR